MWHPCIVLYYFKVLIYFIHDSITLTSSEYNISSDGAISLSQSSSVRTHPDNELVLVAVSAFRMWYVKNHYGLRHPMKLVPLATLVHMDIKAFPSCPSVPLLITNSIVHHVFKFLSLWTPCLVMFTSVCCKCGSQTSVIGYVKCAHFIHDSITLTSSEFDVSSDGLQIPSSSQSKLTQ
ncbi:hypothetical protein T06_6357 [Trichinella sp. T6]|nr:hypothetical protein T06_6357 [Trichinella sp. T6]